VAIEIEGEREREIWADRIEIDWQHRKRYKPRELLGLCYSGGA
jgi:hypothetical protein